MGNEQTVFLTGATGFVGRHILQELLRQGYAVRCLVRRASLEKLPKDDRIIPVCGDLLNPESFRDDLDGVSAAIHLVGIIVAVGKATFQRMHVEGLRNVVDALKDAGVKRFVHMSALGTREDASTEYHRTKWDAERIVHESSLDYTIFRPSIIHGPDGEFMQMLAGFVAGLKPVPVIGSGSYKLQPVYVNDIAKLFVGALENVSSIKRTYDVGGPEQLTFNEMLDIVSQALVGKRRFKIHAPIPAAKLIAFFAELLFTRPPVTREQITMLQEDNVCDNREFLKDFDITLARFSDSLSDYAHFLVR